jgi:hypothetical protein
MQWGVRGVQEGAAKVLILNRDLFEKLKASTRLHGVTSHNIVLSGYSCDGLKLKCSC